MSTEPDHNITILCGLTHSRGFARILPHLAVHTGSAQYGKPAIQKVLELD